MGRLYARRAGVACALALAVWSCAHRPQARPAHPGALALPHGSRVVVFAPHPDDETLAVGGLIHRLARQRIPIQVVFLTNGDGYPEACVGALRVQEPTNADYVALGALREQEALAALRHLGLGRESVRFLGFPDGGLKTLWRAHWALPYVSPYTREDRPPYRDVAFPRMDYEGRDLTAAVAQILRDFRPTLVIMPHPADTHPDHAHASYFVTEAIDRTQAEHRVADLRVLAYLVHYPSWPVLRGPAEDRRLVPIGSLPGTVWTENALTDEELAAKRAALAEYKSQLEVMRGFLRSFAGENELLAAVDAQVLAGIASVH